MKLSKSALLTAGIAAVMLMSGCVAYKPPPTIIHADNYTAETLKEQRVIPPADRVLGIKEAIRIGLTNNPTYKQKHLAIVTAWAAFYTQLAAYSPVLTSNFGAQQAQSSATGTTGAFNSVATTWGPGTGSGNMAATWNVFNGFQTTMAVLGARATALSAEELDKDYRRQLIFLITQSYNAILLARATIQIDLSDEAFNVQQLRDSQLKYNAGASSLSDLLNFKLNMVNAQDAVVTGTADYKINRFALAALMGLTTADLPEETQFPPIEVPESEEYSLAVDFYLDLAISQRPDLKSARLNLDSLRYALYGTWGQFSPSVDLTMNYGYGRATNSNWGDSAASPRGQDLNYNYGFTASWILWQGGSRIAAVRGAQAALYSQEETVLQTWITVVQQVRAAYTSLLADMTHRKLLGKVMQYSQQRRDLVREEYNAGNTDISNLNIAQQQLITAELGHVKSVIGVSNSRAQLDEACGTNVLR